MSALTRLNRATEKQSKAWQEARLHAGHFAFMRAVVQGLDTRQSWDRYLRIEGEHDDIRHVRRTIQRIRDEFASAARRHARHGVARLMQIDATAIDDASTKLPTLEEFAEEHGLTDFSQAEQLEFFRERFGAAPGSASRRRRVIARQLDALRWLEELVAVPPKADDPPSSWIHPDIADRLESTGIDTLGALIRRINGIGYRWWAGIPGIGAGKAERIAGWLRTHESSLGLALGSHVDLPRSQADRTVLETLVQGGASIVPIEKFVAPPGLSGADGRYRAPVAQCRISAHDDRDAVLAWVASKPENGSTRRSYLKEGERFLLWAVLVRGKPLSSLDPEDCTAYLDFMADPQPASDWCGPRGREKWSPLWRPFEGPLSDTGRRHAVVVLKNLFSYLVSVGYLARTPWQDLSLPRARKAEPKALRRLSWQRMLQAGLSLPRTSAHLRLALALQLIGRTGLKVSELVAATVDDLQENDGALSLRVRGRARKDRQVPLPSEMRAQLADYLLARGLQADPLDPGNRGAHLLGQATDMNERAPWSPLHLRDVDPKAGIAAGTLQTQLKAFFADCAESLEGLDDAERTMLREVSADKLRGFAGTAE